MAMLGECREYMYFTSIHKRENARSLLFRMQVFWLYICAAYILWSLELASDLFHDFFAYDIGGEELDSTLLYKGEIPEGTRSRLVRNFASQVEFGHGKRALEGRNPRPECRLKLHFFYLCFSYYDSFPRHF